MYLKRKHDIQVQAFYKHMDRKPEVVPVNHAVCWSCFSKKIIDIEVLSKNGSVKAKRICTNCYKHIKFVKLSVFEQHTKFGKTVVKRVHEPGRVLSGSEVEEYKKKRGIK